MKNYSIVRSGNEYIVHADEGSVLKIASRRQAARLVNHAAELLDQQLAPPTAAELLIDCDSPIMPGLPSDPAEVP